jgi:hypothetical protein
VPGAAASILTLTACSGQVEALKTGFHEMIPAVRTTLHARGAPAILRCFRCQDLIQIFSPQELELLLCGLPSIDGAREHCRFPPPAHPSIPLQQFGISFRFLAAGQGLG